MSEILSEIPAQDRLRGVREAIQRGADPMTTLSLALFPDRPREPWSALAALTDRERECFVEHVLRGRSLQEIADGQGTCRQAVDMSLRHAYRKLARAATRGLRPTSSRTPRPVAAPEPSST